MNEPNRTQWQIRCAFNGFCQPVILVADDLTPSETIRMDKSKLMGFITRQGSSNSHTAILARTLNIPALVGVELDESWDGQMAVLDGYSGCVYVDPDGGSVRYEGETEL